MTDMLPTNPLTMWEKMTRPRQSITKIYQDLGYRLMSNGSHPIILWRQEDGDGPEEIMKRMCNPTILLTGRQIMEIEELARSPDDVIAMVEGVQKLGKVIEPQALEVQSALASKDAENVEMRRQLDEMQRQMDALMQDRDEGKQRKIGKGKKDQDSAEA